MPAPDHRHPEMPPSEDYKKRGKRAINGYRLFGLLVVLPMALIVLVSTIRIAVFQSRRWLEENSSRQPDSYVAAKRGNIYSDEGIALAISVPKYKTYIDYRAGGFRDSLFRADVGSLAKDLSEYFGDASPAQYRERLMRGYERRNINRQARVVPFEISHTQLRAMREMPYLCVRNKNVTGFKYEMTIRREKPFGTMASRTIGFLQKDTDSLGVTHGSSGLELSFDSLLCGTPGVNMIRRTSGQWLAIPKVVPVDGQDIYTTLNVTIQDIVERSLRQMLVDADAEWGTAIVLEVETGAIKALSNLNRITEGNYRETTNHALADLLEPGSTIKTPTMMAALEKGAIAPEDTVNVGNGLYRYKSAVIRDHNAHRGGYGKISYAQAIEYSSNIGVALAVLKAYENDRQGFLDQLRKMSFLEPINLEIPGVAKAYLNPDISTWSAISLAWMAFGYESQIPPIYMARFYNAIANDGKMMDPYIVEGIKKHEQWVERRKPRVVNPRIASKKTLKQIREMLRGVVTNGTAKNVNSPYIEISGKTGTAQIQSGGGGHNVSFCGFFPSDNPKYTCMVTVSRPRRLPPSGGLVAGAVVRSIAEQIYATTMTLHVKDLEADSLARFDQRVLGGRSEAVRDAVKMCKVDLSLPHASVGDWLSIETEKEDAEESNGGEVTAKKVRLDPDRVPDFRNFTVSDAVYLAESLGLRVQIVGTGSVVSRQSLAPGTSLPNHKSIAFTLR